MLPEEDVPMIRLRLPKSRLQHWFDREVTKPLTAMYSRLDEHQLQDSDRPVLQRGAATRKRTATSE